MPTATRPDIARGVVDVEYIEDEDNNQRLLFPDGCVAYCDASWIADQIEDGAFLLVSLIDSTEVKRRLG
jgi:hypothetical protein